jgi:DNA-binding MarR family transcriptional regulator
MADPIPLARLLAAAARRAIDELHEDLERHGHGGIRPVHGYALVALDGEGLTIAALGAALGITKQAAGKLVISLDGHGYVRCQPDPRDRRARLVTVAPRGRDLLDRSAAAQAAVEARWASRVGPGNVETLRASLEQLLEVSDGRDLVLRPLW